MLNAAVLIVGAGPTGLTLANDLARRRVPFRIIDAKPGIGRDSKGLALNVSSQYAMRLIGLGNKVGAAASHIERLNIHWQGKRYASINFKRLAGAIKALLTQPQSHTEAQLQSCLADAGQQVDWSHTLLDLVEHKDHVSVSIATPCGETVHERYQYLAGCDGKHSAVRAALGTSFDGKDYPMYFALGDFRLDWDISTREVQYCVYEDGFFILVPIGEGMWRIVVKFDGALPERAVAPSDIVNVIQHYWGTGVQLGEPLWLSRAPFYHRVAARLSSDRLFIAGDAAHLFSPIGGTGMNTGIQDALNLGWKLAFAHHGLCDSAILKSYERERLPEIKKASSIADLSTRLICGQDWQHPIIGKMAPRMGNRHDLRKTFPRTHSGMAQKLDVGTIETPVSGTHVAALGAFNPLFLHLADITGGHGGHNCLTAIVILHDGVLAGEAAAEVAAWRARLQAQPHLRVVLVMEPGRAGTLASALSANEQLIEMDSATLRQLVSDAADITLVRPDGITAHAWAFSDNTELDGLLRLSLFGSLIDSSQ